MELIVKYPAVADQIYEFVLNDPAATATVDAKIASEQLLNTINDIRKNVHGL